MRGEKKQISPNFASNHNILSAITRDVEGKLTSSSAVADKPARRAASRQTAKFLKQLRDHNHHPL